MYGPAYAQNPSLSVHAAVSRGARCKLMLDRVLIYPCFVYPSIVGPQLVSAGWPEPYWLVNMISTIISCTGLLMSRDMRFPTMCFARPAKPQISLRIRAA